MTNYPKKIIRFFLDLIKLKGELGERARPDNFFAEIAGVPVHYDRFPPPCNYGTRGAPHKFFAADEFIKKLNDCFEELWRVCPCGRAQVITSAGAYVDKPGWHGKGMAFDLGGIFWKTKDFLGLNYSEDTKFYLGVNSILLKHFGTVLNYNYDRSHRDHFHIQDDGYRPGFRDVTSILVFLQPVLNTLFDEDVRVDGSNYDSNTREAVRRVLDRLGIYGHIDDQEVWLAFLTKIAEHAFKGCESCH